MHMSMYKLATWYYLKQKKKNGGKNKLQNNSSSNNNNNEKMAHPEVMSRFQRQQQRQRWLQQMLNLRHLNKLHWYYYRMRRE